MHRLQWVDRARILCRQLHSVGCFQAALACLDILKTDTKIFDYQFSDWRRHPAILVAMIVHRAHLTDFPTDRN